MNDLPTVEHYLNQLGRNYDLVDYSFVSQGGNVYRQICSYNQNRVALYIDWPSTQTLYFKLSDGSYVRVPHVYSTGGNYCWITTSQHLILPFQEIWYFDNLFIMSTTSAYGIVRTGA